MLLRPLATADYQSLTALPRCPWRPWIPLTSGGPGDNLIADVPGNPAGGEDSVPYTRMKSWLNEELEVIRKGGKR